MCRYSERKGPTRPCGSSPPAFTEVESLGVPGLLLIRDFVDEEEEASLVVDADNRPWDELKRRRVQHQGYRFEYESRQIDTEDRIGGFEPMATMVARRIEQVSAYSSHATGEIDQLTVNEYSAGVGLSPHVDSHSCFEGPIAIVSLLTHTIMSFRKPREDASSSNDDDEGDNEEEGKHYLSLLLPPRSLLVMYGEARLAWEHYIPHRKEDLVEGYAEPLARGPRRLSYTYRRVRHTPCPCTHKHMCDSQNGRLPPTRRTLMRMHGLDPDNTDHKILASSLSQHDTKQVVKTELPRDHGAIIKESESSTPAQMEVLHVHDVYDAIAPHFSATRFSIWPKVREFLDSLVPHSLLVDLGCGNGKYFGVRRDIFVLGSDISEGLILQAAKRLGSNKASGRPGSFALDELLTNADVLVADGMKTPFRSESCDALISIAVLHHMSTPQRRVEFLEETLRLLKPGGRALVTVWATEQENMDKLRKWHPIQSQGGEGGGGDLENHNDYFVPWNVPFHRVAQSKGVVEAKRALDDLASGTESMAAKKNIRIDAEKKTVVFQRFYHLFVPGELTSLVNLAGGEVEQEFYDKDNWCIVYRKKKVRVRPESEGPV